MQRIMSQEIIKKGTTLKIKDIVFTVDEDTITKTKIIGTQEKLEREEFGSDKMVIKKYYLLKGETSRNDGWISGDELFIKLEDAQKVITDKIQREAVEKAASVNIVDYSAEVENV
jgi:hypothetical protein